MKKFDRSFAKGYRQGVQNGCEDDDVSNRVIEKRKLWNE